MAMFFLFYSRPQESFEFTHKKTETNVMFKLMCFLRKLSFAPSNVCQKYTYEEVQITQLEVVLLI